MARRLTHVDLYDAALTTPVPTTSRVANGGLALVVQPLRVTERLGATPELSATLSNPEENLALHLAVGRVLVATYDNAGQTERELWRLTGVSFPHDGSAPASFDAVPLWQDLHRRALLPATSGGGVSYRAGIARLAGKTAAEALAYVLDTGNNAPPGYSVGSVDASVAGVVLTRDVEGVTVFEAVRFICDHLRELGHPCDWTAAWSGTATAGAYAVSIVDRVGDPNPGDRMVSLVGDRFNRDTNTEAVDAGDVFTRVVALGTMDAGAPVTLADARWRVVGRVVNADETTLTLAGSPVWEDGALVGRRVGDGHEPAGAQARTSYGQVASSQAPNVVTVAGVVPAMDFVRFAEADGSDVVALADDAAEQVLPRTEKTLSVGDLVPYANLVAEASVEPGGSALVSGSADLSEWETRPADASGNTRLPRGAVALGATVTEEPAGLLVKHGSSGARVVVSGNPEASVARSNPSAARRGLAWKVRPVPEEQGGNPLVAAFVHLRLVSGAVIVQLRDADGTVHPVGQQAYTNELITEALSVPGCEVAPGDVWLEVVAGTDQAEFVVDAVTVTQSGGAFPYAAAMGPRALWRRAADLLVREGGLPEASFNGRVFNSALLGEASDEITLGDAVTVQEWTRAPVVSRVVELVREDELDLGSFLQTFRLGEARPWIGNLTDYDGGLGPHIPSTTPRPPRVTALTPRLIGQRRDYAVFEVEAEGVQGPEFQLRYFRSTNADFGSQMANGDVSWLPVGEPFIPPPIEELPPMHDLARALAPLPGDPNAADHWLTLPAWWSLKVDYTQPTALDPAQFEHIFFALFDRTGYRVSQVSHVAMRREEPQLEATVTRAETEEGAYYVTRDTITLKLPFSIPGATLALTGHKNDGTEERYVLADTEKEHAFVSDVIARRRKVTGDEHMRLSAGADKPMDPGRQYIGRAYDRVTDEPFSQLLIPFVDNFPAAHMEKARTANGWRVTMVIDSDPDSLVQGVNFVVTGAPTDVSGQRRTAGEQQDAPINAPVLSPGVYFIDLPDATYPRTVEGSLVLTPPYEDPETHTVEIPALDFAGLNPELSFPNADTARLELRIPLATDFVSGITAQVFTERGISLPKAFARYEEGAEAVWWVEIDLLSTAATVLWLATLSTGGTVSGTVPLPSLPAEEPASSLISRVFPGSDGGGAYADVLVLVRNDQAADVASVSMSVLDFDGVTTETVSPTPAVQGNWTVWEHRVYKTADPQYVDWTATLAGGLGETGGTEEIAPLAPVVPAPSTALEVVRVNSATQTTFTAQVPNDPAEASDVQYRTQAEAGAKSAWASMTPTTGDVGYVAWTVTLLRQKWSQTIEFRTVPTNGFKPGTATMAIPPLLQNLADELDAAEADILLRARSSDLRDLAYQDYATWEQVTGKPDLVAQNGIFTGTVYANAGRFGQSTDRNVQISGGDLLFYDGSGALLGGFRATGFFAGDDGVGGTYARMSPTAFNLYASGSQVASFGSSVSLGSGGEVLINADGSGHVGAEGMQWDSQGRVYFQAGNGPVASLSEGSITFLDGITVRGFIGASYYLGDNKLVIETQGLVDINADQLSLPTLTTGGTVSVTTMNATTVSAGTIRNDNGTYVTLDDDFYINGDLRVDTIFASGTIVYVSDSLYVSGSLRVGTIFSLGTSVTINDNLVVNGSLDADSLSLDNLTTLTVSAAQSVTTNAIGIYSGSVISLLNHLTCANHTITAYRLTCGTAGFSADGTLGVTQNVTISGTTLQFKYGIFIGTSAAAA